MAGSPGLKSYIACSRANQNTDSAAAVVFKFPITPGPVSRPERVKYHTVVESDRSSLVDASGAVELSRTVPKSVTFPVATDDLLAFLFGFGAHNGAASTATQIGTTGVYLSTTSGGIDNNTAKSFTMEDIGKPGSSDDAMNNEIWNVVIPSWTLSGAVDGAFGVSASFLGGGKTAAVGTPTVLTPYRGARFAWKDFWLTTNSILDSIGTGGSIGSAAPSSANVTDAAYSKLSGGTISDWTLDCVGFSLTANTEYNVAGSLRGGGDVYVPTAGDWDIVGQSVEMTLTMIGDASNIGTLLSEYDAGTERSFAFHLWSTVASPTSASAWPTAHAAFARMLPKEGSLSESNTMGGKTVSITYTAQHPTTASLPWVSACTMEGQSGAIAG